MWEIVSAVLCLQVVKGHGHRLEEKLHRTPGRYWDVEHRVVTMTPAIIRSHVRHVHCEHRISILQEGIDSPLHPVAYVCEGGTVIERGVAGVPVMKDDQSIVFSFCRDEVVGQSLPTRAHRHTNLVHALQVAEVVDKAAHVIGRRLISPG